MKTLLTRIKDFFTARREVENLRHVNECLRLELHRAFVLTSDLSDKAVEATSRYEAFRAQLMQLRVSQSTVSRAGWEVMCFIPEEVLGPVKPSAATEGLVVRVATELVRLALAGVNRVRQNGQCCALVFEPLDVRQPARAPRFVQALWDFDGKFKLSEKCWDQRTEEQRVKNAAGTV